MSQATAVESYHTKQQASGIASYQTNEVAVQFERQMGLLYSAYDFFNERLFGGSLPPVVILFHRHRGARGYFGPERWTEKLVFEDGTRLPRRLDEVALNPEQMQGRTDKEVLSTLVHEMAHVWQEHYGAPSRNGYHNRQWADKMEQIGLMPSTTGEEGGDRTGPRCSHWVIPGGEFDLHCTELLASEDGFRWICPAPIKIDRPKSKVKYECSECGETRAWAKPNTKLKCGECGADMETEDEEEVEL